MVHNEVIKGDDVITLIYPDFEWKCGELNFFETIEKMYPAWGYPRRATFERTIGGETWTWQMSFTNEPDPRSI